MILRNFISLRAFTVYMKNSLRFEISLPSIWPKWNLHRSGFRYARSHVNADNEVTSHRSEILPQTGLSSLRVSCKRALWSLSFSQLGRCHDWKLPIPGGFTWSYIRLIYITKEAHSFSWNKQEVNENWLELTLFENL